MQTEKRRKVVRSSAMADLDCLVRVSRVGTRKGDSFQSPKAQRDACRRDATNHGHRILKVFEELDVSGGASVRPGLDAIIARIESGESQGIIVARFDRFSRSLSGALAAIDRIEKAGGVVVSVAEKFDTTTPIGRAVVRILLVLAELYRDQQTEAFAESRRRAVERGVHIVARVPFGYTREKGQPLEPDNATAAVVREIFERRALGEAYSTIYRDLNARGITTTEGGRWTTVGLAQLIENRAYLGEARSGRIVNAEAHPALVDAETWQRAQGKKSRTPHRERKSLLAGLIRCAGCSRALTGGGSLSYFCHGQHAAGRCPAAASIRQARTDEWVVEQFFDRLGSLQGQTRPGNADLTAAQAAVDRAERELVAWRDDVQISDLDRGVYLSGLETRVRARDDAIVALELAREKTAHVDLPTVAVLEPLWDSMTNAEKRKMLGAVIDVVFLRGGRRPVGERLHICWRGEAPAGLPRPSKITPIVSFPFPDVRDGDDAAGVPGLEDLTERGLRSVDL